MERINLICLQCDHYTPLKGGCEAFPFVSGGIPEEILQTNRHDIPLPGQKNDLVFMARGDINQAQSPAAGRGIL